MYVRMDIAAVFVFVYLSVYAFIPVYVTILLATVAYGRAYDNGLSSDISSQLWHLTDETKFEQTNLLRIYKSMNLQ